ncbi:UvrD-helicase domain-containing protein [Paenibacillus lycopersici]|uniref:DNA 3'-5' helicase n=1 Tax=Paenibacillus lycopersici TaxID=2704462 RepID=A0A6C0G5F3_9BACL|nr:ATP-dependent helicase [Paenibacillus lycopersici]QHT62804.1 UvrD-helicase domain-containing protein [Paenibacillus lycopersici]
MAGSGNDFFARKHAELGVALNEVQKKAVLQTEGALLLLASPGSGKTTTVIMRIGYLIEVKGVHPSRIKAVTFSRASAQDMKDRYTRFFPDHPDGGVQFSTIHSFAFEVMREHLRRSRLTFQIIEGEVEQREDEELPLHKKLILRDLYRKLKGENLTEEQMEELTTYISFVKNKLLPEREWESVKCDVPEAAQVAKAYEAFKRSFEGRLLVDYDDMLVLANGALEDDGGLLWKYQNRYDYVLTDESQDTSLVQHAIIEKLARRHGCLCVVADDDQSIYTWRAAEPQYLLDFRNVFPEAAVLKMEQNYRSSRNIVDIANRFIKRNEQRYDKNMFTRNPGSRPIYIKQLDDYKGQAKYVAAAVEGSVAPLPQNGQPMHPEHAAPPTQNGRPAQPGTEALGETAVLYRNNASSIMLMNEFDRRGIPFYMKDGDNRFFSHWVLEDVLGFMRMAYTDKRPDLLEKIHTKMAGYVSKVQMAALTAIDNGESVFDNLVNHVPLKDYQSKQLLECKELFQAMRSMEPRAAIRLIRFKLGYERAIDRMCERLGFRKENLTGILNTLEDIADGLATLEDFANRLKYLEAVMKASKKNKNANAVTFSTLHSAKGLEFERVFMIDLIDGIIPSNEDMKKTEGEVSPLMEESVRLFYVGMTRAKRELTLLSYAKRDGEEATESQFVKAVRELQSPRQAAASAPGRRPEAAWNADAPGRRPGAAKPTASASAAAADAAAKTKRGAAGRGAAASRSGRTAGASSGVTVTEGRPGEEPSARNPRALKSFDGLKPGDPLVHAAFGPGAFVSASRDMIEIDFAGGRRKLSAAACIGMGLVSRP